MKIKINNFTAILRIWARFEQRSKDIAQKHTDLTLAWDSETIIPDLDAKKKKKDPENYEKLKKTKSEMNSPETQKSDSPGAIVCNRTRIGSAEKEREGGR